VGLGRHPQCWLKRFISWEKRKSIKWNQQLQILAKCAAIHPTSHIVIFISNGFVKKKDKIFFTTTVFDFSSQIPHSPKSSPSEKTHFSISGRVELMQNAIRSLHADFFCVTSPSIHTGISSNTCPLPVSFRF